MNKILSWLGVSAWVFCMSACAPLMPSRTDRPDVAYDPSGPCSATPENDAAADPGGVVSNAACAHRMREDAKTYQLYFTEFDDEGWAYPSGAPYGGASEQMGFFISQLQDRIRKTDEKLSVVVFVHGWKHTADNDDNNVQRFRTLLSSLNDVERQTGCERHVIGLYVAWRGAATTLGDPLESASFYSRKNAAERVAEGDVRVVFSHLRALQDEANAPWIAKAQASLQGTKAVAAGAVSSATANATAPAPPSPCEKRVRLSIAGHSFGGLIVYTSLAQSLIRDVVELRDAELLAAETNGPRPVIPREGDLVVVVNPAIEATRYEPLFRAVGETDLPHYHSPLFVSITSTNDLATKVAFPLGRKLSTLFEHYPVSGARDVEERANQRTLGQDDDFLNFQLTAVPYPASASAAAPVPPGTCAGWNLALPDFGKRLAIEWEASMAFLQRLDAQRFDGRGLFPRYFCGGELLRLETRQGVGSAIENSPVWNIRTQSPIVNDHNDFSNPLLIAFFRQLYREAELRPFQLMIQETPGTAPR